ncbi:hypothetical protein HY441_02030 [Candidatus Microgenomates bacterium]|nr:hypothetical protein [Candidatus Microgenomates bacterium]
MAYTHNNSKGVTYYLHSKEVTLRGGRRQRIYYFAKKEDAANSVGEIPSGFKVVENPRNGFLALKRG